MSRRWVLLGVIGDEVIREHSSSPTLQDVVNGTPSHAQDIRRVFDTGEGLVELRAEYRVGRRFSLSLVRKRLALASLSPDLSRLNHALCRAIPLNRHLHPHRISTLCAVSKDVLSVYFSRH